MADEIRRHDASGKSKNSARSGMEISREINFALQLQSHFVSEIRYEFPTAPVRLLSAPWGVFSAATEKIPAPAGEFSRPACEIAAVEV